MDAIYDPHTHTHTHNNLKIGNCCKKKKKVVLIHIYRTTHAFKNKGSLLDTSLRDMQTAFGDIVSLGIRLVIISHSALRFHFALN